ncbi:hypothetical protein GDO81_019316 [Engystomops pustulosus]|uniref:Death domain-containing protein n=1 Tax=Engystomops pustulosus TaxID=76066 RepID=A0AAV6ZAQ8_ENGPU|nr:hypothetical protein GDO81_019316 [Engystomops pustulosus]
MESYSSPDKPEYLPGHKVYVVDGGPQIQNEAQSTLLPLPDITLQTKTPSLKSTEVLYKIIDCIPVPRWKEMIRLLGVSDNNIERCMQENRHYKEAQYEMLSYWVHGAGSSQVARETLFNVLREMHLGGCVEKIQEFL